jgi:hypothetical protein
VIDHDRLFKDLLGHFLADFLRLFAPDLAAELKPARPVKIEPLRQELLGRPKKGKRGDRRYVDFVAKLRTWRPLIPGPSVVYVHVDAQARRERGFPTRMLHYYAHLVAWHGPAVYPIALFSHRSRKPEPEGQMIRLPGLEVLQFRYRVVQLARLSWRDFLDRPNPAAAALMARMGMEDGERPIVKAACWRMLAGLGLEDGQARVIAQFVQSYLPLDRQGEKLFRRELGTGKEGARVMECITSWEKDAHRAGRREGLKEGALKLVRRLLVERFGRLPGAVTARLRLLSTSALEELAVAQIAFTSLSDLERWLTKRV